MSIYKYVLYQEKQPVLLIPRHMCRPSHSATTARETASTLSILFTCTQIHDEGAALFYKLNRLFIPWFHPSPHISLTNPVYPIANLVSFFNSLSITRRAAIQEMAVETWVMGQPLNPYADTNFHVASNYLKAHGDFTMTFTEEAFYTRVHLPENVETFMVRKDT